MSDVARKPSKAFDPAMANITAEIIIFPILANHGKLKLYLFLCSTAELKNGVIKTHPE